jgi:ATP-dependent helicase HepA
VRQAETPGIGIVSGTIRNQIRLLGKAGEYHLRSPSDPETGRRFQTLWYRFGERGVYGHKPVTARVVFTFGADPARERHPRHAYAFITRRGDIGSPPRRDVLLELEYEKVRRPLHFVPV